MGFNLLVVLGYLQQFTHPYTYIQTTLYEQYNL
jgi:hypothetical protein